jgi:hypothetical protein
MMSIKDDLLDERKRAEDILLGSLGFGEDASILSIQKTKEGYQGKGQWTDGSLFEFESDDELGDLEVWALGILTK